MNDTLVKQVKIKVKEDKVKIKDYDVKIKDPIVVAYLKGCNRAILMLCKTEQDNGIIVNNATKVINKVFNIYDESYKLVVLKNEVATIKKGCIYCDNNGHCTKGCKKRGA